MAAPQTTTYKTQTHSQSNEINDEEIKKINYRQSIISKTKWKRIPDKWINGNIEATRLSSEH